MMTDHAASHDRLYPAPARRPVAAITCQEPTAERAAALARAMYGWPLDAVTVDELPGGLWHVTLYR